MENKDVYLKKAQAQLDQLGAEVDKLKAKADSAKPDARASYQEHLKTLHEKQDAAKMRLRQLKDAGDENFEDMKANADRAAQEFDTSLQQARGRFN